MAFPGAGIAKGMALTLRRFFEPKVTVMYPEVRYEVAPKFRGRLQLLYDEWGTLKCETCFQCAQACPIECIDMGGIDTRGRYHVHWGPPEQYAERREESALRRSGRPVSDKAFAAWLPIDLGPLERILVANATQLVIVASIADPPPRPRLIDRCLVAAYAAGMRPLYSRSWTNSPGNTRPSSGCCQRNNASAPTIDPSSADTTGW